LGLEKWIWETKSHPLAMLKQTGPSCPSVRPSIPSDAGSNLPAAFPSVKPGEERAKVSSAKAQINFLLLTGLRGRRFWPGSSLPFKTAVKKNQLRLKRREKKRRDN